MRIVRTQPESDMELSNRFSPVRSPGLIAVARRFVFVAGLLAVSAAFGAITDKQTADPFSSFNVTNAGSVEFTISFTDSHGTFPLSPGFTKSVVSGTAHYHHTATTPGSAENFLQNLTYDPVENRIPHEIGRASCRER